VSNSGNGSAPALWIPGETSTWQPGRIRQQTGAMTLEDVRMFQHLDPWLLKMGLTINCTICTGVFGLGQDGVRGGNTTGSDTLVVECNHLRRVYKAEP